MDRRPLTPAITTEEENASEKESVPLPRGNYFTEPKHNHVLIHSGAKLFDMVLGGGWAGNRMINIVGDSAAGKTYLATEANINFHRMFPNGLKFYNEIEEAFDEDYAAAVGWPTGKIEMVDGCFTVQDVEAHITEVIKYLDSKKTDIPVIYTVDSWDALSSVEELETNKAGWKTGKATETTVLFRKINKEMSQHKITLFIISQLKDKIGVTFGEQKYRAGGAALDFYASQIVWLARIGMIKKTRKSVERAIGMKIRAKVKKNKIGLSHRECDMPFLFGYGLEDLQTSLDWLLTVNRAQEIVGEVDKEDEDKAKKQSSVLARAKPVTKDGEEKVNPLKKKVDAYYNQLINMSDAEFIENKKLIDSIVEEVWYDIEREFLPKRRKHFELV